jgi:hypothetical protein
MKKALADSSPLHSSQYVRTDAWAHPGGPQEDTVGMVWADLSVGYRLTCSHAWADHVCA